MFQSARYSFPTSTEGLITVISKAIVENVLIITAEGFWLSANWSQLRRLIKTHNSKGLSAPTMALNAAGNIAWATYFASLHLWVPFSTNLTMLAITTIALAYLLGNREQFLKGVVSIAALGPATSYLLLAFTAIAGWVGVAYNGVAGTPQLIRVVTLKKVSGISEKSLFFSLGAMLCTLTYALLIKSTPLIVGCVQGMLFLSVIMNFYYRYRNRD